MNIEVPNDFPDDDADETELPLPEAPESDDAAVNNENAPAEFDTMEASADDLDTSPGDVAPIGLAPPPASDAPSIPSQPTHGWDPNIDWSQMKPAPGYEDPATGKIRWMPIGFNPLDGAIRDIAEGRHKDRRPEGAQGVFERPPQMPVERVPLASPADPQQGGGANNNTQDTINLNLKVELADEALDHISTSSADQSSHESFEAIRVLAQRLSEFISEQKMLENARRTVWGR